MELVSFVETFISRQARRIAVLGNYIPRRCGIATFTNDLVTHIRSAAPNLEVDVFAMDDGIGHEYAAPVRRGIPADDQAAYDELARELNESDYDVLCVQHEFGIFGGEAGSYLLQTLRQAKMPIVTTLHTVLQEPSSAQRSVFTELIELSQRVVVMGQKGFEILTQVYNVDPAKIELIPHGIHAVDVHASQLLRERHELQGKPLILTFGLLSRDKGIDSMVRAMGEIVREYPNAVYAVVGATHPHVKAREGEAYRQSLIQLAAELGVQQNILFIDRFVSNEELAGWLAAADIYVTPYLKPQQITSGTLAYALGSGCAVVSTPYWHAEELLADGRGVLVPFNSPSALAEAIGGLIGDPARKAEMSLQAFNHGLSMRWPLIGKRYCNLFDRVRSEVAQELREILRTVHSDRPGAAIPLPVVNLHHVGTLTDDTGIVQHAKYRIPNRYEGYCTDDNARAAALMLSILSNESATSEEPEQIRRWLDRYVAFLFHAFDPETARFRNFMGYDRTWLDAGESEDAHGRAVQAFAQLYRHGACARDRMLAGEVLRPALATIAEFKHLRPHAYGLLAASELLKSRPAFDGLPEMSVSVMRLKEAYKTYRSDRWAWFEPFLTYGNAALAHACIEYGDATKDDALLAIGLEALAWLMDMQTSSAGHFVPVGCSRVWRRGDDRPWFDQQPIEAGVSVSACATAARVTGDSHWSAEAERAFNWFLGGNILGLKLVEEKSGACADGLESNGINQNCGAESTLAYVQSAVDMQELLKSRLTRIHGVSVA